MQQPLSLSIPNRLQSLATASAWLLQSLPGLGVGEPWLGRFDLCASEALSNIMGHGYADAAEHAIDLSLQRIGSEVCLQIRDDGIAFDPLQHRQPPVPTCIEDAPIGGLSIAIILRIMTRCEYQRDPQGNCLRMFARIPKLGC